MGITAIPSSASRISPKAFGKGIGIVVVLYLLLAGYLLVKASDTRTVREEKLASETVPITRETESSVGVTETHGPVAPGEATAAAEAAVPAGEEHSGEVAAPEETSVLPSSALTLESAPVEGLYEDTTEGRLPKVAEEGLTPFDAYKRPFIPPAGAKTISIALVDAGISESATAAALSEMPADVSLVITPYAVRADYWLEEARAKGFETWLSLPMETDLYPFNDPGPQTLLINGADRLNINKLHWTMSRGSGYAGLVTGAGASFLRSAEDARLVLNEIFTRGLGFIDGDTAPAETPAVLAKSLNAPYQTVDVWIDVPSSPEHIAASFRQLEVLAEGRGRSIGFIHATPQSMKSLKSWLGTLPDKGYVLAPLSAQAGAAAP